MSKIQPGVTLSGQLVLKEPEPECCRPASCEDSSLIWNRVLTVPRRFRLCIFHCKMEISKEVQTFWDWNELNGSAPYPRPVSMACPKVWPRLRVALTPPSLSSAATTAALLRQDCSMAYVHACTKKMMKQPRMSTDAAKLSQLLRVLLVLRNRG